MLMYVALPRRSTSRTPTLATIAIASILVFLAASNVRFDRSLLSSGVYRFGGIPAPGEFTTTFYKDGRTATVTVKREPDGNLILSTNGKPDASVSGDWLGPPAKRKRRSIICKGQSSTLRKADIRTTWRWRTTILATFSRIQGSGKRPGKFSTKPLMLPKSPERTSGMWQSTQFCGFGG